MCGGRSMPPRVPSGRPSTCASCERSPATRYIVRSSPIAGSPIASRLTRAAAATYPSMSAGETPSTSAMLSNPAEESSGGSSALTSTSSASRSRMAFAYSARFRRCSAGAPGIEPPRRRAIERGFERRGNVSRAAAGGFGAFSGGIMPVRSLRTTFSQTSAWPSTAWAQRVERQAAGLRARVVTGDAVPASGTPLMALGGRRRRASRRRRRLRRDAGSRERADATRQKMSCAQKDAGHRACVSFFKRASSMAWRPASWWRGTRPPPR